jgi:hypothetical protein
MIISLSRAAHQKFDKKSGQGAKLLLLNLAGNSDGPLKTADEVEALLIEEVRRLGHATMTQWAVGAEERVSQELKEQQPEVLSRKKKR